MQIPWNKDHDTGIKEIDYQHRYYLNIINSFYRAIEKPGNNSEIKKLFFKLDKYLQQHFATEEKYFDLCDYKDASVHKNNHRQFYKKLIKMKIDYESGNIVLTMNTVSFLEKWLVNHIFHMDKKFANYYQKYLKK